MLNSKPNYVRVVGFVLAIVGLTAFASEPAPVVLRTDTPEQHEARLAWWREARFGLFIHWGLYAIPARGEWVQWNEQIPNEDYAKLADQFKPEQFDATAWAQLAKNAGTKYVVLTSRHHDGFALFDDPGNNFTSVSTVAHRDFVAEYTKAMRAAGLRIGLYYSPLDWRFPGFILPDLQRKSAEAMRAQYHRQMELLLTHYGPLDMIWFDGGETDWLNFGADWKGSEWKKRPREHHYTGGFSWEHDKVYAQLRHLQPQVLINGRADMPEDFRSREGDGALGDFDADHPWELCTTIVNGPWGWKPDAEIKSLTHLVQMLVRAAGRDGNYLLNVGPRPDGTIEPAQAQRLREIGAWLRKNGESIFGTRGGPFLPGEYGVSTFRENVAYLHILNWRGEKLTFPALPGRTVRSAFLVGGEAVKVDSSETTIEFSVQQTQRDATDTIVKLEFNRSLTGLTPVAVSEVGLGR